METAGVEDFRVLFKKPHLSRYPWRETSSGSLLQVYFLIIDLSSQSSPASSRLPDRYTVDHLVTMSAAMPVDHSASVLDDEKIHPITETETIRILSTTEDRKLLRRIDLWCELSPPPFLPRTPKRGEYAMIVLTRKHTNTVFVP